MQYNTKCQIHVKNSQATPEPSRNPCNSYKRTIVTSQHDDHVFAPSPSSQMSSVCLHVCRQTGLVNSVNVNLIVFCLYVHLSVLYFISGPMHQGPEVDRRILSFLGAKLHFFFCVIHSLQLYTALVCSLAKIETKPLLNYY